MVRRLPPRKGCFHPFDRRGPRCEARLPEDRSVTCLRHAGHDLPAHFGKDGQGSEYAWGGYVEGDD